jgi:hypothetical protein
VLDRWFIETETEFRICRLGPTADDNLYGIQDVGSTSTKEASRRQRQLNRKSAHHRRIAQHQSHEQDIRRRRDERTNIKCHAIPNQRSTVNSTGTFAYL